VNAEGYGPPRTCECGKEISHSTAWAKHRATCPDALAARKAERARWDAIHATGG
jgi:hypothetical protein